MDSLDRAFLTFRLPPNGKTRPVPKYRRLDLIVVNWNSWGTALQSWTGSTQFNRDLRRWCTKKWVLFWIFFLSRSFGFRVTSTLSRKSFSLTDPLSLSIDRGYKLDAGGIRNLVTDQAIPVTSEKDLFRLLELEYIRKLEYLLQLWLVRRRWVDRVCCTRVHSSNFETSRSLREKSWKSLRFVLRAASRYSFLRNFVINFS